MDPLIAASGLAVACGVFFLGRHISGRVRRDQRLAVARLRDLNSDETPALAIADERIGTISEAALAVGAWLTPRDHTKSDSVKTRLALGGFRQESAVFYYSAIQLILVLSIALLGVGSAILLGVNWQKTLLLGAGGAALGLLIPSMMLSSRVKARERQFRKGFPDALDILVLSVEGGASVNAALAWAAEELPAMHPLLGEEMAVVQRDVQLGLAPSDAFQLLATRCGLEECRELAAALLQSERFGASLAKALRAFADTARLDRAMWAEEVAQKASVKIIFPMLLCIFPAIFIVLLGPAAAQMSRIFAR